MSALEKLVYRFEDFELDPAERRLAERGTAIALTPKVFDTLVLLVQQAGHVVSKSELMKALWPRGYVEESNLTKHIWLIRRALRDVDEESRFIETVPKLGYRFIAPVTTGTLPLQPPLPREPHRVPAIAAHPPAALPFDIPRDASLLNVGRSMPLARGRRALPWTAGAFALALTALAIGWRLNFHAEPTFAHRGHTVALVAFSNLSHNAKDAWLAPALNEMLGAELNVADDVQVVPDELVRDASADLSAPAAGGYAVHTLGRLRQRLGADYVLSGSYLVSGSAGDAPLRIDIALQDARTGALVASVAQQSVLSGLMALVTGAGVTLRGKLGAHAPDPQTLGLVANAQPPSVDAARRLGFALDALQHYDAARARDELLEAVAQAPGYAPAYTYLAQAWAALGYRDKALAAAQQAALHAGALPPEQRLQLEAVLRTEQADWSRAAVAWQALTRMKPQTLEYRLQTIDAQIAAGTPGAARSTLHELQQLPEAAADPRVELDAARVAEVLDDAKGSEQHAGQALKLAEHRDAAGLIAAAQLALGGARMHINKNEEALADFLGAIAAYRAIRNPRGEASARIELAEALINLDRNQEAREEFQRAMGIDQSIGDLAGVAAVYRNLCSMLWMSGDRDGAQAAARRGLELGREIGDLGLQIWTLQALATIGADEEASEGVIADYREVISLSQRAGHHFVWPLANLADVQRMRGQLDIARATCAQAQAAAAPLSDPQFAVFSGFICALIESDRGNSAAARAGFEEVIRRVATGGDTTYRDNAQMMLAQLDMDEHRWDSARLRLEQARRGFAAAEVRTGEADAAALQARCAQELGDGAARDEALEHARTLRQSITSRQEVYMVDIALARLDQRGRSDSALASDRLLALGADAERRHFVGWALEARLAAWELLRGRAAGAAATLQQQLEHSARQHGYGRILTLLAYPDSNGAPSRRSGRAPNSKLRADVER